MTKRRRRRRNEQEEQKPDAARYLAVFFGAVAVVAAVVVGTRRDEPSVSAQDHDHDHDHPTVPAMPITMEAKEIASHFVCACGGCNDLELATCSCGTAAQGRNLIQAELDRGASKESILQLVNDRYGGLKPEFAGLVKHKG